uniref:CBS domain-containing protein n=1 Tax=Kalanchoe fedtschenkoi TaxID=63787 RepID=A0A7N0VHB0_KALFE
MVEEQPAQGVAVAVAVAAATDMDMSEARMRKDPLRGIKVRELIAEKRRLVEVPYTATLSHTLNALVANRVVAVPVAAPPGQWIGAGGSMILESDKHSGAVRKHYIGMITMLDILAHIAGDDGAEDSFAAAAANLDSKMCVPVSSVIGHCLESLSLWTLSPNTSKGIHRALVPLEGQMENVSSGVELVESASSYQMLTQMDVLKFFKENASQLEELVSQPVGQLGAVTENVFAVTNKTPVIEAIKCMRAASLTAVPIIEASGHLDEDPKQLVLGRGRKLTGTLSATDLKGCSVALLQSWLPRSVQEFTAELGSRMGRATTPAAVSRLVDCTVDSSLGEVVEKAVNEHVHRVWVVDNNGSLYGLISLSDMIRVIRLWMLPNPFQV